MTEGIDTGRRGAFEALDEELGRLAEAAAGVKRLAEGMREAIARRMHDALEDPGAPGMPAATEGLGEPDGPEEPGAARRRSYESNGIRISVRPGESHESGESGHAATAERPARRKMPLDIIAKAIVDASGLDVSDCKVRAFKTGGTDDAPEIMFDVSSSGFHNSFFVDTAYGLDAAAKAFAMNASWIRSIVAPGDTEPGDTEPGDTDSDSQFLADILGDIEEVLSWSRQA